MSINQSGLNVKVKVNLANNRIKVVPEASLGVTNSVTTLKSQFATVDNIGALKDVIEGTPQDGDTLVYDAETDKYVVTKITDSSILLAYVDGGYF